MVYASYSTTCLGSYKENKKWVLVFNECAAGEDKISKQVTIIKIQIVLIDT